VIDMMRLTVHLIACAAALAQVPHQNHPPRSAGEYARVLESSSRDAWQKPHEVIEALKLRPDEAVADIGAGSGYFTRRLAKHAGKVYAVDIDQKLLELTKKNSGANVITVLATPDDPKLPAGAVDTIFFCNVLHHIEARPAYYAKLLKALKPGGRLVNIDFYKRDLPMGPPVAMKLSEGEVEAEMKAAGLRLFAKHEFLPHQYFLVFRRSAD
jgi:ubiquinone/menaquinone biosynthesis C-methylase UbiE